MNETPPPASDVPSKCAGPTGGGIEPNPCTEPGSLPRCKLCPNSPSYWRRTVKES
jgi:hypothetical protein